VDGEAHFDEAVARIVEIAAADRDVVVQPRRRRRLDSIERRRQGFVVEGLGLLPFLLAVVSAKAPPASLARLVSGALLGNRRVGLAVDRAIGAVDQSLGRGEAQPDLREPPVGLDEAHVPEVDEIGAPDEILAKALELLRVVAGKPIGISLDDVALALGAAKDLAIGHRDAPRDLGLVETVATQQIKRQRPERVAADRKHLQEGRDRADTVALLECEGWRHARFAYLAGSLIDDEGGRCLDMTKTERTLR